jgi:hypothetical protein
VSETPVSRGAGSDSLSCSDIETEREDMVVKPSVEQQGLSTQMKYNIL